MVTRGKIAGEILTNLRIEWGYTQQELMDIVSATAHCSERHYRRIEKGECVPSITLAIAICSALDSNVYEVWG